tara:strand:- start:1440 stop:1778 length:339 start_codon:yes stop_codon:yes gene_type:complete
MPALLAIPALISSLIAGLSSIITYLLTTFGRKLFIGAAFITVYTALLVTFVTTLNSEFTNLLTTLPNNSYSLAGLSLVPSNAITCATIVVTAKAAQMLFYFSIGILRVKLKA